jgi:hypothetical protein
MFANNRVKLAQTNTFFSIIPIFLREIAVVAFRALQFNDSSRFLTFRHD